MRDKSHQPLLDPMDPTMDLELAQWNFPINPKNLKIGDSVW